MPTPREHVASTALDGLIHVIGGRSPTIGIDGTTHEVYDPVSDDPDHCVNVEVGRTGVVTELPKDGTRCRVLLDPHGRVEVWIMKDKEALEVE